MAVHASAGRRGDPWCALNATAAVSCQNMAQGEAYKGYLVNPGKINPDNGICYVNNLTLTMRDGTKLVANVFLPKITSPGQTFPSILFVNSWSLPDWEHVGQAYRLAKDGYVVMAYATRGWFKSEGLISAAAPDDILDVSDIVDWLGANVPMDSRNLAASRPSWPCRPGPIWRNSSAFKIPRTSLCLTC
jgi:predicted acyl esterase